MCSVRTAHAHSNHHDQRLEHANDLVQTLETEPDFSKMIITGDKTWCFACDLEKGTANVRSSLGRISRVQQNYISEMKSKVDNDDYFLTQSRYYPP